MYHRQQRFCPLETQMEKLAFDSCVWNYYKGWAIQSCQIFYSNTLAIFADGFASGTIFYSSWTSSASPLSCDLRADCLTSSLLLLLFFFFPSFFFPICLACSCIKQNSLEQSSHGMPTIKVIHFTFWRTLAFELQVDVLLQTLPKFIFYYKVWNEDWIWIKDPLIHQGMLDSSS